MDSTTETKAIETLDRMRQIVKNDMLTRGEYVTQKVVDKKLAEEGAVCRGRKACAIGSLWLAYGVELENDWGTHMSLPGTEEPAYYARNRPALKAALNALNAEAEAFIEKNPAVLRSFSRRSMGEAFDQPIEQLFEGAYGTKLVDRDTMLKLITGAKRRVRRAARAVV